MIKMTKKLKKKWQTALVSGNYAQGFSRLRLGNQHGSKHCCLGVLEDVSGISSFDRSTLRDSNGYPLLIEKSLQQALSAMNDDGATFSEIAERISSCSISSGMLIGWHC